MWRDRATSNPRVRKASLIGQEHASSGADRQMHMLYCCQNHSGSPALTAPVPKEAPAPCATIYGFAAPEQATLDLTASSALDTLRQAELSGPTSGQALDARFACYVYQDCQHLMQHQSIVRAHTMCRTR